jgi:purine-binding chemotaxis protein CheW
MTHATPQDEVRVLAERAAALAREPKAPEVAVLGGEAVWFQWGGEGYVLETRQVREVVRAGALCPVPGTPPFVLGLAALRGAVLPVFDLAAVLGRPPASGPADCLLVLGEETADYALAVQGTPELGRLPGDLQPAPDTLGPEARPFVKGILGGDRTVLDGPALLAEARLFPGGQGLAPSMGLERREA